MRRFGGGRGRSATLPAWMSKATTTESSATRAENILQSISIQKDTMTERNGTDKTHAGITSTTKCLQPRPYAMLQNSWSEHTAPDGRLYYYNSVTKESTYERPAALKPTAAVTTKTGEESVEIVPQSCLWTMYHDAHGRPYYVNSVTRESRWEEPVEHKVWRETGSGTVAMAPGICDSKTSQQQPRAKRKVLDIARGDVPENDRKKSVDRNNRNSNGSAAPKAKRTKRDTRHVKPLSKRTHTREEAQEIFWGLLRENDIQSDTTWAKAHRHIVNDPRYHVFKKIGQRRQSFSEYVGKRKKEEKQAARERRKTARRNFIELLQETKRVTRNARWYEVESVIESDARFKAVGDRRDRQEIFDDFVADLREAS